MNIRIGIVVILLLFISCTNEDKEPLVDSVLLVYLAADNSLSNESENKLHAIANGLDEDARKRILVYHDTRNDSPSLLELTGAGDIRILETYEEENSADAEVFRRVIIKSKSLYPQAQFNLLIFSHGSGWLPKGKLSAPTRTIIQDNSNELELTDFAGLIPDNAFNCVVLETCFSAGIEVAYALRNKAQYILASSAEIISPGFTPVYPENMSNLLKGVEGLKTFAQATFNHFNNQQGDYRSATLSIIDTSCLEELGTFIKDNYSAEIHINITDIQHFDRYAYRLFFDFEDYYSRLLSTEEQKQTLSLLLKKSVLWKASTEKFMPNYDGFDITKHSGLTVYAMQKQFITLNDAFLKTEWGMQLNLNR